MRIASGTEVPLLVGEAKVRRTAPRNFRQSRAKELQRLGWAGTGNKKAPAEERYGCGGLWVGDGQSGCGDVLVVADDDGAMTGVAVEGLGAVEAADSRAAPGAVAAKGVEANYGTRERREESKNDERYTDEDTQAGEAEHDADDDTDGRDDEAEKQAREGGANGCGFNGMWRGRLVRDGRAAAGAEGPGRLKGDVAFRTGLLHWIALLPIHHGSTGQGAGM